VENFDQKILQEDADFERSNLKADSIIRLGFLAVLPIKEIPGAIGSISTGRYRHFRFMALV